MTNPHWEKVARGRYASEMHGHIIQCIRRDGPYDPAERPYVAVVDRVPIGDAWNLSLAKTKAIQFVARQNTKSKAERLFKPANGHAPTIPDPIDTIMEEPEPTLLETRDEALDEVEQPAPPHDPPPDLYPVEKLGLTASAPGQLTITGKLSTKGDLLDTLNALRSALELLREHADLDCSINLPPVLKL